MRFAAIILSNARKVALPTGIGISMKIAQIAPLYEAVPPKLYAGTERIVAHLSNALVELGHQVTLFASADADTRATLVPVRDQAIRLDPSLLQSNLAAHLSMLHELHLRRHAFDLLHFHVDLIVRRFCGANRDHAARSARPEGSGRGLFPLARLSPRLDLGRSTQTARKRELGGHYSPWPR